MGFSDASTPSKRKPGALYQGFGLRFVERPQPPTRRTEPASQASEWCNSDCGRNTRIREAGNSRKFLDEDPLARIGGRTSPNARDGAPWAPRGIGRRTHRRAAGSSACRSASITCRKPSRPFLRTGNHTSDLIKVCRVATHWHRGTVYGLPSRAERSGMRGLRWCGAGKRLRPFTYRPLPRMDCTFPRLRRRGARCDSPTAPHPDRAAIRHAGSRLRMRIRIGRR